jgi:hypothetical protein
LVSSTKFEAYPADYHRSRKEASANATAPVVLGRHEHGETEIFQVELPTDESLGAANLRSLRTVRVGQFVELLVSNAGVLGDDGLRVTTVIESDRLPAPVRYSTRLRRD